MKLYKEYFSAHAKEKSYIIYLLITIVFKNNYLITNEALQLIIHKKTTPHIIIPRKFY